jgi:hypothetical protein
MSGQTRKEDVQGTRGDALVQHNATGPAPYYGAFAL